jgi:hypothetical protein
MVSTCRAGVCRPVDKPVMVSGAVIVMSFVFPAFQRGNRTGHPPVISAAVILAAGAHLRRAAPPASRPASRYSSEIPSAFTASTSTGSGSICNGE